MFYGALPLPPEENVNGSLGRLPGTRTLVYADSPSRLTTISTLKRLGGVADFTQSRVARTVSADIYAIGGEIRFDPNVITFSAGHQPLSGSGAVTLVAKAA